MSYVVCFIFSKDRKQVCLILKIKPKWQEGRYNGIGGKVEEGETPEDACIREVKEEVGLNISLKKENTICTLLPADGRGTELTFFRYFLASYQIPVQMEKETIQWFTIDNLPVNMIVKLFWLIPMALYDDEHNYSIEEIL